MLNQLFTQPPVFPFEYDKNGNSDRNSERFTRNFNQWHADLRESLLPVENIMNNRLEEAKELIK